MTGSIAATRLATLAGEFDRNPAYAGLADTLRLLIGDGRVDIDLRLPSERDLSVALAVSRTTVTRAYASLVETGYAVARQGSGTYTRVPGGRRQALDRTLTPHTGDDDVVDLSCAAPSGTARDRRGVRRRGGGPPGVPRRARLLPHRAAVPAGGDRGDVRRARAGHGPGADPGGPRCAVGADGGRPGPGRHPRARARGVSRLSERARRPRPRRCPSGRGADGRRRVGPRRRRAGRPPGIAPAGLPHPRLPEPHGQPDGQRPARAVRRSAAADGHHPGGRRVPRRPVPRRRPDAATVRHVLPRHDHAGEREQEPLGRAAGGVDPLTAPPGRALGRPPASRSTWARRSTSSWSPHGCSSTARSSGQRTAPGCACSATPSSRRSRSGFRGGVSGFPGAGCRCGASCRRTTDAAARARSPRRPSDVVSWCHPARCSPPRVASTPSSGSPSPGPRTSSATPSTGSRTRGAPSAMPPTRRPSGVPA